MLRRRSLDSPRSFRDAGHHLLALPSAQGFSFERSSNALLQGFVSRVRVVKRRPIRPLEEEDWNSGQSLSDAQQPLRRGYYASTYVEDCSEDDPQQLLPAICRIDESTG